VAKVSIVPKAVSDRYSMPVSSNGDGSGGGGGVVTAVNPFLDSEFSQVELSEQIDEDIEDSMDSLSASKIEFEKLVQLDESSGGTKQSKSPRDNKAK